MNGRKARGLRNEAAHYAKLSGTRYELGPIHTDGRYYGISPRVLIKGCHRAVYQQLKRA